MIGGVEVVLPQNFATTVKRENSFFTKNGEYTYDCTLRLDNQTNRELYGFLQRLNKKDAVQSKRSAVLMADGRVYCRGTEVITGWTDEEVTVQVVSGNSELNYFIGNDLKIEWLDLGEITTIQGVTPSTAYPDTDFCLPTLRTTEGHLYNGYIGSSIAAGRRIGDALTGSNVRPQPYLCAILRRLMVALGYTVGENHLEQTIFKYLFFVNTIRTVSYAKMFPGWTVKDFLSEVEALCGVVFVTDNILKKVDIVQKSVYYANSRQTPLQNVVDEYDMNVEEEEQAEFTSSDVNYDIPSHFWAKMMRLPDGVVEASNVVHFDSFADLIAARDVAGKMLHDRSTDRYYIQVSRTYMPLSNGGFGGSGGPTYGEETTDTFLIEVNQMRDIRRSDSSSTLSLKITPAPMASLGSHGCEVIDIGTTDGYKSRGGDSDSGDDSDSGNDEIDIENTIRNFEKSESAAIDLYAAFHNGFHVQSGGPIVYTDAYHALVQNILYPFISRPPYGGSYIGSPVGSLRLQDIESELYAGVYRIDTTRKVVFETYDPNMLDPRAIIVVRNRRWVVREIEETLTSSGRKPSWKVTCHPIEISDESAESRWVLTRGVWDDGGAWLDDGRWNDN